MTIDRAEITTTTRQISEFEWEVEVTMGYLDPPLVHSFRLAERPVADDLDLFIESVTIEVPGGVVNASLVRGLADSFERVERLVRAQVIAINRDGEAISSMPKRRHRKLDDGFLRDVVRRHAEFEAEGKPPTATLAHQEGVTVGAVKGWLRRARERGIEAS